VETDDTPAIEFLEVNKRFDDFLAVDSLTLSVQPSEFIVLLGPSGCGKSTILKMIAGIEDPTEGEIYVHGRLVNYVQPRDRDVAMVFQNYALYPHMTVAQNIGYPLRTRRVARAQADEQIRAAAKLVDLEGQLSRLPGSLSGGQRQRVALARAIIRRPVAFLMDEPLSNLDALLRAEMRRNLLDVHQTVQRATIYVTHDQLEAMTMADQIVVMREGKIQQAATPREVYERPANLFVAGFVGSPAMNFLPARGRTDGKVVFDGYELTTEANVAALGDQPLTVGMRATDLALNPPEGAENRLKGTIKRVEYAGPDTFFDVVLNDAATVRVRGESRQTLSVGDAVTIACAPSAVHVFSAEGQRVASRG
jgi:multiple sugar transport system ATP-binding protein